MEVDFDRGRGARPSGEAVRDDKCGADDGVSVARRESRRIRAREKRYPPLRWLRALLCGPSIRS